MLEQSIRVTVGALVAVSLLAVSLLSGCVDCGTPQRATAPTKAPAHPCCPQSQNQHCPMPSPAPAQDDCAAERPVALAAQGTEQSPSQKLNVPVLDGAVPLPTADLASATTMAAAPALQFDTSPGTPDRLSLHSVFRI